MSLFTIMGIPHPYPKKSTRTTHRNFNPSPSKLRWRQSFERSRVENTKTDPYASPTRARILPEVEVPVELSIYFHPGLES